MTIYIEIQGRQVPVKPPADLAPLVALLQLGIDAEPEKYAVEIDDSTRAVVGDKGIAVLRFRDDGVCDACAVNEVTVIGGPGQPA